MGGDGGTGRLMIVEHKSLSVGEGSPKNRQKWGTAQSIKLVILQSPRRHNEGTKVSF